MKLTKRKAIEYSIIHWELKVKYGHYKALRILEDKYPKISILKVHCGLCEKYRNIQNDRLRACAKCPIRPKIKDYDNLYESGCCQEKHLFNVWWNNKTKKNAQNILDLLKSIKI